MYAQDQEYLNTASELVEGGCFSKHEPESFVIVDDNGDYVKDGNGAIRTFATRLEAENEGIEIGIEDPYVVDYSEVSE